MGPSCASYLLSLAQLPGSTADYGGLASVSSAFALHGFGEISRSRSFLLATGHRRVRQAPLAATQGQLYHGHRDLGIPDKGEIPKANTWPAIPLALNFIASGESSGQCGKGREAAPVPLVSR